MRIPHHASAFRLSTSYTALSDAASLVPRATAERVQMQWTLAVVCGLIIGVISLSLAIPPCIHAFRQLREVRQQALPNTNHIQFEQVAAPDATSTQPHQVEENAAQPLPLSDFSSPSASVVTIDHVDINVKFTGHSRGLENDGDVIALGNYRHHGYNGQDWAHQPEDADHLSPVGSNKCAALVAALLSTGVLLLNPVKEFLYPGIGG
ncbi:hypothetical protein DPSP01_009329 [Paraphaeosphaeria sporulosa]